jgi:hypothetical protein
MSYSFRQVFMPYCVQSLGDGWFIFLNRHYKPLGHPRGVFVTYETDASKVHLKGFTDARACRMGLMPSGECYYLYDDSTNPESSTANWQRYVAILAKLMKYQVDREGPKVRGPRLVIAS